MSVRCNPALSNARISNCRYPAISCRGMKEFANSAEESVFRRLVTMSVRSARFASGRRCFRKFERTTRSSRAMPASAFSTIRKTWITPSRLFRQLLKVIWSVVARSVTHIQFEVTGRIQLNAHIAQLPIFECVCRMVADEVLVLQVPNNFIANAAQLKSPRPWRERPSTGVFGEGSQATITFIADQVELDVRLL